MRIYPLIVLIHRLTYARLQNKTTEQIIGALHVVTFSRAGGISVPLVYSSTFAGRATGGSILWESFSTIAEEARHSSALPARSTRYTPPTLSWMSLMDGLQDRGATAIQTSWPTTHLLWKILPPNVSNACCVYRFSTVLRRSFWLTNRLVFPQRFCIKGSSAHSTYHAVAISFLRSRGFVLTFVFGSCLQDIVGARFHCVVCDSVDICSNCESAGLPGNLDSSDGGHDSSHIMIKVRGWFLCSRSS